MSQPKNLTEREQRDYFLGVLSAHPSRVETRLEKDEPSASVLVLPGAGGIVTFDCELTTWPEGDIERYAIFAPNHARQDEPLLISNRVFVRCRVCAKLPYQHENGTGCRAK